MRSCVHDSLHTLDAKTTTTTTKQVSFFQESLNNERLQEGGTDPKASDSYTLTSAKFASDNAALRRAWRFFNTFVLSEQSSHFGRKKQNQVSFFKESFNNERLQGGTDPKASDSYTLKSAKFASDNSGFRRAWRFFDTFVTSEQSSHFGRKKTKSASLKNLSTNERLQGVYMGLVPASDSYT